MISESAAGGQRGINQPASQPDYQLWSHLNFWEHPTRQSPMRAHTIWFGPYITLRPPPHLSPAATCAWSRRLATVVTSFSGSPNIRYRVNLAVKRYRNFIFLYSPCVAAAPPLPCVWLSEFWPSSLYYWSPPTVTQLTDDDDRPWQHLQSESKWIEPSGGWTLEIIQLYFNPSYSHSFILVDSSKIPTVASLLQISRQE